MTNKLWEKVNISRNVFGNKIVGTLTYKDNSVATYPLIVLNSGYGPRGSNSQTWRRFISEIASRSKNIAVLTWDYSGQGNSGGNRLDLTPFKALSEMRVMVDWVLKSSTINIENVGIYGSSFGGYIGLLYAGTYGGISSMFLKSPVSDYAEVREIGLGQKKMNAWRENGEIEIAPNIRSKFDFYTQSLATDIYSKIAPRIFAKVKIIHGDADTTVPIHQSRYLVESLPNAALEEFVGVDHDYQEKDSLSRITKSAVSFFTEAL